MQWFREEDALDRVVRRGREEGERAISGGVDSSGAPSNFAEVMRRARSRSGMRPRSPPGRNTAAERPHQLPEDTYYYPSTDSFVTHDETSPPRLSGSESPIASAEFSDPYTWTTRPDGSVIPPSRMDISMDLPTRLPRITPRSPLPDVFVASEADTEPLSLRGGTAGGPASLSSRIARRRLLLAARAGRPDNAPTFTSRDSLPDGERAARIEAEHGLEPVFANGRPDMEAARRNIEAIDRRMRRIRRDAERIEGLASSAPAHATQREEQGGERGGGSMQGQLEDLMRRAESINERYESLGFPVDGAERRRMRRRVEMLNEQYASFASREDGEQREAELAGQRPVGADPRPRRLHIEAPSARFRRIREEREERRRLNPNMPSGHSGVERRMGMDGNGDLENDSGNMWHTLLTTMSPDPQPPSASSSFDTLLADVIAGPYHRLADGHRADARRPLVVDGEREEQMDGDTSILVDGPGGAETSASTSMSDSASEARSGDTSQTSISPPDASPVGPSPVDPVGGLSAHADFENVCETYESQPLDLGVGANTEVDEDEEDIYELRPASDPALDRFWRGYTDVVARRADRVARHSRLRSEHPLGGMQRIVQRLASRDDIPDDWWAGAGLTRILPREA